MQGDQVEFESRFIGVLVRNFNYPLKENNYAPQMKIANENKRASDIDTTLYIDDVVLLTGPVVVTMNKKKCFFLSGGVGVRLVEKMVRILTNQN